jgi:O-antigen/teichoic acid export membrane protein
MNHGLVVISPVILVRLLPVEDFGRYREFLLYVTILVSISGFGINSSLLRFIPGSARETAWRFVNQAAAMTLISSLIATAGTLLLNVIFDGKLVGDFAIPVALYVLFFVNLDFWESLYLAEGRSLAVLRYTTGRLVARIAVATTAAAFTRSVDTIIYALIGLEAVRLAISAYFWRRRGQSIEAPARSCWREQLEYTVPFGAALVLTTINTSLGALFVAKMLGPIALAYYMIGTYLQPVIGILRNSLSDVVLPEMVVRNRAGRTDRLALWRRTTVVSAILLVGAGVVLARFADILIVTVFSEAYRPAVPVFQLYLLVFLREMLDFGIPLRAISRTASIMHSNLAGIVANGMFMFAFVSAWGTVGAAAALVLSRFIEGAVLGSRAAHAYGVSFRALVPWGELLKVLAAAALAACVLIGDFWTETLGLFGVVLGGGVFAALFAAALAIFRVKEAILIAQKLGSLPALAFRRH